MKRKKMEKNQKQKNKKVVHLDFVEEWTLKHGGSVIYIEKDDLNKDIYELNVLTPDMIDW